MPELPEIANRAKEMQEHLTGRKITAVEVIQPKCLNETPDAFRGHITGAIIRSTNYRGKWILTELNQGWLLLNLGMGGELLLVHQGNLPSKYRLVFDFENGESLSVKLLVVRIRPLLFSRRDQGTSTGLKIGEECAGRDHGRPRSFFSQ